MPKILSLMMLVIPVTWAASAARADELMCRELRETGQASCFHQNDQRRGDCSRHCARCEEQITGCIGYCEQLCYAPYPEGCSFEVNECTTRCSHRCHEPACAENAGCKTFWCGKEAIQSCSDSCNGVYASLASCRSAWCGDGKMRKSCLDGCSQNQGAVAACRKAWCGDGKDSRQCYLDADELEHQCVKQVETDYKACIAGASKKG